MYPYAENLTKQSMLKGMPWECAPPEVTDKIREVKEERQAWYRNPNTKHWFYTGYEALNPNARVSNDNPAFNLNIVVADLDSVRPITREAVDRIISTLPIAPNYLEKSIGNGWRLLWVLADPVRWPDDKALISESLVKVRHTLGLMTVRCLDEGSWISPTRLYCNGGVWEKLSDEPLDPLKIRACVHQAALEISKKSRARDVPLPRIEELIRKKWPDWEWDGEFKEGSQGPSWWIPGSTSTKSAIVHADGMYTFAAHAEGKSKHLWNEILGENVVEQDRAEKIMKACADIYHDGKTYWSPREGGGFHDERHDVIRRKLTVTCGLYAERGKKQKNSEVDEALAYIEDKHRIDAAAPILFKPSGIVMWKGSRYLNTSQVVPCKPVEEPQLWVPDGTFPFIYDLLTRLFVTERQLKHFLSWLATFYQNALRGTPHLGQAVFLSGGQGIGKTLVSHHIVGGLAGGAADAGEYLMGQDSFGGELFKVPVWAVDDQIMNSDAFLLRTFTNRVKKHVANPMHNLHEKYQKKRAVEWLGRLFITCNLDAWSQTVLPALEDSIMDKINFYKLIKEIPLDYFPIDVEDVIAKELAFFGAYVRDYQIPAEHRGGSRYRVCSYQDSSMVEAAYHNSGSIGHVEIAYEFLRQAATVNERYAKEGWSGTATQLITEIRSNPGLEGLVSNMSPRQMNLHLSSLMSYKKLPALQVSERRDASRLRIWTIKLKDYANNQRNKPAA